MLYINENKAQRYNWKIERNSLNIPRIQQIDDKSCVYGATEMLYKSIGINKTQCDIIRTVSSTPCSPCPPVSGTHNCGSTFTIEDIKDYVISKENLTGIITPISSFSFSNLKKHIKDKKSILPFYRIWLTE
jgi:hypothetical protein